MKLFVLQSKQRCYGVGLWILY